MYNREKMVSKKDSENPYEKINKESRESLYNIYDTFNSVFEESEKHFCDFDNQGDCTGGQDLGNKRNSGIVQITRKL